ncbi:MAG: hypothetical protein R2750_08575 [Bacteroidales bacterium]
MTKTNKKIGKTILILSLFSIAMGFMEGAVVVYLRKIYYPNGFTFPLIPIDANLALTEILRESATLIMLITIGILAGRTKTERFGFFIFCFAVWDITYYISLYLILGWPSSVFTWDILFLIPVTWVGPVIGPVLNSISMILLALLISYFTSRNIKTNITTREWLFLIIGSLTVIISYTEDYVSFMQRRFSFWELISPKNNYEVMQLATAYIPESFAWGIFIAGEIFILLAVLHFFLRNKKTLTM